MKYHPSIQHELICHLIWFPQTIQCLNLCQFYAILHKYWTNFEKHDQWGRPRRQRIVVNTSRVMVVKEIVASLSFWSSSY